MYTCKGAYLHLEAVAQWLQETGECRGTVLYCHMHTHAHACCHMLMHIVMYIHMEAQPFLAVQPNHPAAAALPHPASALAVSPAPPPHRRPTPTPTQPGAVAQPFLAGQQFQEDVSGSIAGFLGVWLLFPRVDLLWFIPAMTSGLQQLQFGFAGEAGECVCVLSLIHISQGIVR